MAVTAEFSSNSTPGIRPRASSLLEATPTSIVRALTVAYPLLRFTDRCLGWLTWTSSDKYESCLILVLFSMLIRNLETVTRYWFPLVIAIVVSLLFDRSQLVMSRKHNNTPTLDEMVSKLESSGKKFQEFIAPLKCIRLNGMEAIRFVLATLLFSPLYVLVTYLWITPRNLLLILGIVILSWHSIPFKVARSLAWRFSVVRFLVFIMTGIDRTSVGPPKKPKTKINLNSVPGESDTDSVSSENQDVEYTFVLYENQRHWLGIGWTANMIPEERAPWTDPSLNEASSIDTFELPETSGTGMIWKWIDEHWMLDVKGNGLKLTAEPDANEGFTYYNNVWSSPSPIAGFSKYTRRRKWVRRAALVSIAGEAAKRIEKEE